MVSATSLAYSRLQDTAAFQLDSAACRADTALEERLGHLGNKIRQADDHASHCDQLIDVCRVQAAHACHLVAVEGTNANVEVIVGKFSEVELFDGRVKSLHDFNWVADKLLVQFCVEVFQMEAVKVKERLLDQMHLF